MPSFTPADKDQHAVLLNRQQTKQVHKMAARSPNGATLPPVMTYMAVVPIKAGEELITDYGHQYFYFETHDVGGSHGDHKMPDYECGMPHLVVAARRGEVAKVRELLALRGSKQGAGAKDAAPADKDLVDALKEAAVAGHGDVVAALVDAGADANTRSEAGGTPLHIAIERFRVAKATRIDVVTALLAKGALNSTPVHSHLHRLECTLRACSAPTCPSIPPPSWYSVGPWWLPRVVLTCASLQ